MLHEFDLVVLLFDAYRACPLILIGSKAPKKGVEKNIGMRYVLGSSRYSSNCCFLTPGVT